VVSVSREDNVRTSSSKRERRVGSFFPIEQDVRYKILYGRHITETRLGRTWKISSTAVWFTTETMLPVGLPVELSMRWPVLLNDSCPLKLVIYGCVLGSTDNGAALGIERYEFRTQGSGRLRQPASQPAVEPPLQPVP
jgi:hypothetical protein